MEYDIVRDEDIADFKIAVQARIREGWQLQGGVCVGVVHGATWYYQTMARDAPPAKSPRRHNSRKKTTPRSE